MQKILKKKKKKIKTVLAGFSIIRIQVNYTIWDTVYWITGTRPLNVYIYKTWF